MKNKENDLKVFKTVNFKDMISILNQIDSLNPTSYPVVFRPVSNDDAEKKADGMCFVNYCGIDRQDHFVWKNKVLGRIMFLNVEIWENVRIEDVFASHLGEDSSFEILVDSFTGEYLSFGED